MIMVNSILLNGWLIVIFSSVITFLLAFRFVFNPPIFEYLYITPLLIGLYISSIFSIFILFGAEKMLINIVLSLISGILSSILFAFNRYSSIPKKKLS
jgi:hypothetical protein